MIFICRIPKPVWQNCKEKNGPERIKNRHNDVIYIFLLTEDIFQNTKCTQSYKLYIILTPKNYSL